MDCIWPVSYTHLDVYKRQELEEGYIHRTVGYETPDDEMDLNYCKEESHESFTYAPVSYTHLDVYKRQEQ